VADPIAVGQQALATGDWSAARHAFEQALTETETAEALDGLGQALWWQNEPGAAIELRQRAYAEFVRRGESAPAIGIAVFLAREFFMLHGNFAAMSGWLGRAQTLLDEEGHAAEAVWLELTRGRLAHDPAVMEAHARQAIALACEFDEDELEVVGSSLLGLALVYALRVSEGMVILDEAMAAATGGEVASFWCISEVYCNTLLACERAGDLERAEQWLRVIEDFSRRHGCKPLFPFCHVIHGGILAATGRWAQAEEELGLAVDAFDAGERAMRVLALARLADLRLRQGRIEEARQLLSGYEEHPLALRAIVHLWLVDGQEALAAATLERRLEQIGADSLLAAPLLSLLVEARLARGEPAGAQESADALSRLALRAGQTALEAEAALATGRANQAAGVDGTPELGRALELYSTLELPYEAARARLALAHALAETNPPVAAGEAKLALASFDRLGAARDADRAAELVRRVGGGTRPGPRRDGNLTAREEEVFELLAAGLTNRQIAERLFLSVKTVEHHVSRLLAKLGLKTRAEAAAAYVRRKHEQGTSNKSGDHPQGVQAHD
jgi:DNA-binding CsgD family transcriptional regulator/tetratricopeptide (TPR) repeat protein